MVGKLGRRVVSLATSLAHGLWNRQLWKNWCEGRAPVEVVERRDAFEFEAVEGSRLTAKRKEQIDKLYAPELIIGSSV
jgi:hypothetical protein